MELSMRRVGQFDVNWEVDNRTQCGPKGTQRLAYDVRIEANEKCLDEKGFIIDNNAVDQYFTKKYNRVRVFESCEKIAMVACEDLRKMLGDKPIAKIEVTIAGSKLARLTARWVRPAPKSTVLFGM